MDIMASGIALGRVRTTAATTGTVESRKMAAILQIIGDFRFDVRVRDQIRERLFTSSLQVPHYHNTNPSLPKPQHVERENVTSLKFDRTRTQSSTRSPI